MKRYTPMRQMQEYLRRGAALSRVVVLLLLPSITSLRVQAQKDITLNLMETIPLQGIEGRIDHFALDWPGRRIFMAALGNGTVEVLDLNQGRRIHTIVGLKEPQGLAYVPELNRLFVASGGDGSCRIYDGVTYRLIAKIDLGEDADNVRYDARKGQVYVGYGAGALTVINAATGRHEGDIKLTAHPESFQLEKKGNRIFVNVPDAREIVVIDRTKRAIVAHWSLDADRASFPMALDEADHRLFVGCRKPAEMVVFDTSSGKVVARVPSVGDADDLWYDAARHVIYVSGGEGSISVIRQTDADHYRPLAKIPTAVGARTSFLVPELGRLCLAVPHRGPQPAELRIYQAEPAPQ